MREREDWRYTDGCNKSAIYKQRLKFTYSIQITKAFKKLVSVGMGKMRTSYL